MSELYKTDGFFWAYAKWHYVQGLRELVLVGQNFLWFVAHFFSFKLLLRTIFAPWKRMGESYGEGFDLGQFASAFIVNSLMRIVGFVSRVVVLLVGLVAFFAVLFFFLGVFLVWLLAPAVLMGSLLLAITFFVV